MKSILAMLAICVMAIGCIQPPPPQPPAVQVDPFSIEINPPAAPYCPPGCCPDGQCPANPYGEVGQEVTSPISASTVLDINTLAATEVKQADGTVGICLPCQPRPPMATQPTQVIPSTNVQPTTIPTPRVKPQIGSEAVKHGAYQCEICRKSTVGDQWEDMWTDDGISLMCVCKDCFEKSSPAQREAAITNHLKRGDPDLLKRASVQQAIKSVSSR